VVRRFVRARAAEGASSNESQFRADVLEGTKCEIEIVARMGGGELAAEARMPLWDNWIAESGHEHAFCQEQLAHVDGFGGLAEDDRNDRVSPGSGLKPSDSRCSRK